MRWMEVWVGRRALGELNKEYWGVWVGKQEEGTGDLLLLGLASFALGHRVLQEPRGWCCPCLGAGSLIWGLIGCQGFGTCCLMGSRACCLWGFSGSFAGRDCGLPSLFLSLFLTMICLSFHPSTYPLSLYFPLSVSLSGPVP